MPDIPQQPLQTAGSTCTASGVRVQTGLDNDGNNVLDDSKIQRTSYTCNGTADLIASTPEPSGVNCPADGVRIQSGKDSNGNVTLEAAEVSGTQCACNAPARCFCL